MGVLSAVVRGVGSVAVQSAAFGAATGFGVGQALLNPMVAAGRGLLGEARALVSHSSPVPTVVWSAGRRMHVDIRPLLDADLAGVDAQSTEQRFLDRVSAVESAARSVTGVAEAHVEPVLARLIVLAAHADDVEELGERVVSTLRGATSPSGDPALAGPGPVPPDHGKGRRDRILGANPELGAQWLTAPVRADRASVVVPLVAAGMDVAAVVGAVAGALARLPAAPQAVRAAVAVVRHQPRVVALVQSRLGPVGTDLVLTAATAAAHGWSQAPAVPLLDLAQRIGHLGEVLAYRGVWAVWEPVLAAADRPHPMRPLRAPSPALKSASNVTPDHSGSGNADYEQIESYLDQAASGSLVAAAGALLGGGGGEDIAGAVLAGVPRAAHLAREGFASVLGRGLAQRGVLVRDPAALRRLDRIAVVLIDGAALRGDHRMVLAARGGAQGWDDDRVFEVGDALLHGEPAPNPDPDEAAATGARLVWTNLTANLTASSTAGDTDSDRGINVPAAQGRRHADLVVDGHVVGSVEVGWEPDPHALALVETARRTGARVVLRHAAGTSELATCVGETYPAGTALAGLVAALRAERGPVLLLTSLHPDLTADIPDASASACADTLDAVAGADFSIALDDQRTPAAWSADIITSPELAEAVRVISALPAARRTGATSVRLAKAGSTLEGLLLTTGGPGPGPTGGPGWLSLRRWVSPVNTTAAIALISGVLNARGVLGLPDPTPVPLTAWHALDPEIVFTRLNGGPRPLAESEAAPWWRRRLDELGEQPSLAPVKAAAGGMIRLAGATRTELNDPLTPILAVGAAASAILGSGVDAALVATVMATNALIGGAQRLRADNAVAHLFAEQDQLARRVAIPLLGSTSRRLKAARTSTRIHRIAARRLSPGDVIELRAQDVVPADARLLIATDLEVDESSLTGESLPVAKGTDQTPAADLGDRAGMVFDGSTIVAGSARAIVVATGHATAARRALATVADTDAAVGVAARLGELTAKVLPLTLASGAAVTGISLLNRQPLRQAVADGVAIAVTAVPEGLPLVATVAQLASARRLSGRGVLVRAPRAVEALGRVDTICFDKTGTLTENKLRVTTAVPNDWDPSDSPPQLSDAAAAEVLRFAARACPQPNNPQAHAHATDEAILRAAHTQPTHTEHRWTVEAEVGFESSRGYAATLGADAATTGEARTAEQLTLVVKGAPEIVLARCALSATARAHAVTVTDALAGQGLRVLAVASRTLSPAELPDLLGHGDNGSSDTSETEVEAVDSVVAKMRLVGFVGIADTLRPSAAALVTGLVAANRGVVLITGDHPVTAAAIASQLGLPAGSRVITGAELADLDEDARAEVAVKAQIFARVSPEQKVQIIQALSQSGRVCAMVGDGANDAAAIRLATVGIGVSSRGSSAARGAADLVVTEDDLTVLLDALAEGRNMWASVRDALVILLGGNAGEVAFTIAGTTLGGRAPISTRQLLLVNLLTDMFPALAVAVTPQQPPPDIDDPGAYRAHRQTVLTAPAPSLDRPLLHAITIRGAVTSAAATVAWGIGAFTPGTRRRSATMGLTALVGTQLAQTLATRHRSPLVLATTAGSAAILIGIVQTPGISHFFGCTPLGPLAWTSVAATTALATAASVAVARPVTRP